MKKTIILALGLLCCLLVACGTGDGAAENSTPLPSSDSPQVTWGTKPEKVEPATTEENQFGAIGVETPEQDDETVAELKKIIMALVMCDYADGMQFEPSNPSFFWRAMNYYTASVAHDYGALSEDRSWAVFPEDQVLYFATRLFGGVETLPELLDTGMIEKREGDFAFMLGNYGDVQLTLGEIKAQEDGYVVVSTLQSSEDETMGSWQVKLTEINGEYCVSGILYG